MSSNRIQLVVGAAVLAAAMAAGWAATNLIQQTVPIAPGIRSCWRLDAAPAQIECLSDEFMSGANEAAGTATGIARDRKVIAYVRDAEELASRDERLAGTCHPAMHRLGRTEGTTAAKQDRVPTFPGGSSQLCTAGYVHGLAEGYLARTSTADVAGIFPKLCHDPAARTGCAHGIGHALVRAEADVAPDRMGDESLELCSELPGEHPTDCYNGVYMEYAMRTDGAATPPQQYVALCERATNVDRELACWGYLGLDLTSNDVALDDVPAWCAKASLPGQFTCIDGYGRDLGAARVAACADAATRPELQQRCIEGAVGLQVGSGHVTAAEARATCATLDSGVLASYCRGAVARYARGRASVERT